jgi:hypothetical protein
MPLSPGSTLELGLKTFRRRGPAGGTPLVPIGITNHDKKVVSQHLFSSND